MCCMTQERWKSGVQQSGGVGRGGRWEGDSKKEGTYVPLWLIHVCTSRNQRIVDNYIKLKEKMKFKRIE